MQVSHCVTNRQHSLCLDDTYHLHQFFFLTSFLSFFYWIKKRSSRGRLLEYLESSGTKIVIEDILYTRYVREDVEKHTKKQTKILEDEFHFFRLLHFFFFALLVSIGVFWELLVAELPF